MLGTLDLIVWKDWAPCNFFSSTALMTLLRLGMDISETAQSNLMLDDIKSCTHFLSDYKRLQTLIHMKLLYINTDISMHTYNNQ